MKGKIILILCGGALIYTIVNYLPPLYAERSGEAEKAADAKLCAPYPAKERGKTNVLYCQCTDSESQVPGKCNEKYK